MINKKRLLGTFIDLVKIDSESRDEKEVAEYIKKKLKKLKIKFYVDNSHTKTKSNHGNIIARIISDPKLPTVVLSSHMDTVVPGRGIKPIVKKSYVASSGDTILGSDDKSGLAVSYTHLTLPTNREV